MYLLTRTFDDGADPPEVVLVHARAFPEGSTERTLKRTTTVVPPSGPPGRRAVRLFLPDAPAGSRIGLAYSFTAVRRGDLWFSPRYHIVLPDGGGDDLEAVPETEGGNLGPPPGWGTFRLALPPREGDPPAGTVRYGFGAMRKKPSRGLCRAALRYGPGAPPVLEAPEALSVLKNRPMPYFLHHAPEGEGGLRSDKINGARIAFADPDGDAALVLLVWSGAGWGAPNATPMEARHLPPGAPGAAGALHAGDAGAALAARASALSRLPVPRTHEGYVFGPEGSVVEFCQLVVRVGPGGDARAEWRTRDGGNWRVAL